MQMHHECPFFRQLVKLRPQRKGAEELRLVGFTLCSTLESRVVAVASQQFQCCRSLERRR